MEKKNKSGLIMCPTFEDKYMYLNNSIQNKVDSDLKGFLRQVEQWEIQNRNDNSRDGYTARLFFRGVNEAKYDLYNSAQRYYLLNYEKLSPPLEDLPNLDQQVNDHYDKFISYLVEETIKSDQDPINEFMAMNKFPYDNILPFLSFMQHYGLPTPLLDFSSNKYAALFFAQFGHPESFTANLESVNDIDNYISLYMVADISKPWLTIRKFFHPDFAQYHSTHKLSYEQLGKSQLLMFLTDDARYHMNSNPRIKFQEGSFIYNSHINWPLDYHYYKILNEQPSFLELYNKHYPEFEIQDNEKKMGWCINIHKKLIPELREILKGKGFTEDTVYPDKSLNSELILDKVIERMKLENTLKR